MGVCFKVSLIPSMRIVRKSRVAWPLAKEITPRGKQSKEGCHGDVGVFVCVYVCEREHMPMCMHTGSEVQFTGTTSILWVYKLTSALC